MPINLFDNPPEIRPTSSSLRSSSPRNLFEDVEIEEIKPKPNFFQRVSSRFAEAGRDITSAVTDKRLGTSIREAETARDQGDLLGALTGILKTAGAEVRVGLRTAGAVAGATFAPITEAPGIKQALEGVGSLISKNAAVKYVAENASVLAKAYPEAAKDIQNIVDISVLSSGVGRIEKAISRKTGEAVSATGTTLKQSGIGVAKSQKEGFVRELIRPIQTKKVKESQVGRTTETGKSIFKRSIIEPTAKELASEKVVQSIPGISKSKTVQQNFNIIKKSNIEEAKKLETKIKANDFEVPRGEALLRIERAREKLAESSLIVGDAEKTASKLVDKMKKLIEENPELGSGILKARKEYDAWVKQQKPNAFSDKVNAFELANREIREALNKLLIERAPNLGIKESLRRQNSLFNAMETLIPKAAQEADTAIGRAMQNIGKTLGTKNKLVQAVAAAAGIGGLGAAATFAPIVAQIGIPLYFIFVGGRLVLKPGVRRAIGDLLKNAGDKISAAERNALLGILNDHEE